ncbi:HAE1 family hydrophobic/amphiphilic exporter-1 [Gracilibacillus halotolerans]|uniref:HAE1 family hydrophobic/amphiphilic exporter-1 n=1 Tax=Gracilibacillus halotolerans TaxID=74386 RepID=A0A841RSQ2_9BACI|nr:efflux RND transporter permease subunit [Gracilibacillus halotolerans]MBB6513598.1 HAE1 family hydrophobic/amphiphilic exporter-1 [Gracilibacillus halotolerans]
MKLIETAVKRPVGVIMIVLAIIALGVISLRNLAIDLFPEIDLPIAVVATSYPDASPQEVEKLVTEPMEGSLSTIQGVNTIQSQSQSGSSLVIIMFENGTNLDNALLEVRESVDGVKTFLPEGANDPSVLRFNPNQMPIMWVGLTGTDDKARLQSIAEDTIQPYFERQSGVASVSIEGGQERIIELELDRAKMNQYGITPQLIQQSLAGANQSASAGSVQKGDQNLQVRIAGDYTSVEDIEQSIIFSPQGAQLTVADVATLNDITQDSGNSLVNGNTALVFSVMKQSDGNTVEVSDNILSSIETLNKDLPEDIQLEVVVDTSDYIKESINSVMDNMIYGGLFALLILLLFLRSVRATIVIGVSIPIAIVSTFILLYFTGETLNILTMGGLALGIGMMVDSSIVILENIVSYRQKGASLIEAAKKGASELAPAVIASTTTTLVVFLPIVFVDGIASELFTPLALTIAFSLLASLVVAVTLVPMLSSKLLTKEKEKPYWFNRVLKKVTNGYGKILRKALHFRKTTITLTIVLIIGSIGLTPFIGTAFIPEGDQGQLTITVETPTGTTSEKNHQYAMDVNEHLEKYNDIIDVNYVTVSSGNSQDAVMTGGAAASYQIELVPASERDLTTDQVVSQLDEEFSSIAGAEITVQSLSSGAMSLGDPIQIQISGPESEVLEQLSDEVINAIATVDGIHNPTSSLSDTQPEMNIKVNRELAAQYGLTYQEIMQQVQMTFTGQTIMQYRESGDEINVKLVYPEEERSTINDLENVLIQNQQGTQIPLLTVADFEQVQSAATITRQNQQRQVNVSAQIIDRPLGNVATDVENVLADMSFPEDYEFSFGGQTEEMETAFFDLSLALILSIFLVYAVMAVQFENFLHPFIIMFSLPTTVIGVIVGLFVTGQPLSITAFIGIIMLAGIVVNNAIILVDYINILRRRGMVRLEAIVEAGKSRLRPILMTTLTTILAMVPLGLGIGEGAEMQQPMAITVIFGLGVSSLFTLLLIPVVYTLFDGLSERIKRLFTRKKEKEA